VEDTEDLLPSAALAPQPVVGYAHGDHAERHRRIMRVFYLNKLRDIGWQLSPADVQRRLREEFGLALDLSSIESALDSLEGRGALKATNDNRHATNAVEWRRRRYVYDITQAGERVEALLAELDGLREESGELDASRLLVIRDALGRIADRLEAGEGNSADVGDDLKTAHTATGELRQGATTYINRLSEFMSSSTHSVDDFVVARDGLIDYLQGFYRERYRYEGDILAAIDRIDAVGADVLVDAALRGREMPAPMGELTAELILARARESERARFDGIRQWFGDVGSAQSPWRLLTERVLEAIRAVLDIAGRIIERGAQRADRARAWQQLAGLVDGLPDGEACALFACATGIRAPRHLGGLYGDHEQLATPQGRTSWAAAEPVAIAAHLRRPGSRTPGAGSPGALRSNHRLAQAKRAELREREAKRERLRAALAERSQLRMSELHTLDPVELHELLAWISRAFAARRCADGAREATGPDGQMRLRLRPPADRARTIVASLDGQLDCPDYSLEVLE
jgi:uncharacterized protein (TIGR02677 family)